MDLHPVVALEPAEVVEEALVVLELPLRRRALGEEVDGVDVGAGDGVDEGVVDVAAVVPRLGGDLLLGIEAEESLPPLLEGDRAVRRGAKQRDAATMATGTLSG